MEKIKFERTLNIIETIGEADPEDILTIRHKVVARLDPSDPVVREILEVMRRTTERVARLEI